MVSRKNFCLIFPEVLNRVSISSLVVEVTEIIEPFVISRKEWFTKVVA